ncbi:MAG TPA: cytochrome c peroxidase [Anaeromyxobacteraceae bacterium]|nr:cytochrome c peroxidase [Anaeromyxobacteraceae bacterium]
MTTRQLFRAAPALALALAACGDPPASPETGSTEQSVAIGLSCPAPGTGFGDVFVVPPAGALPFVPIASLKTVPNPVVPANATTGQPTLRSDLFPYVANVQAAIQLGKALFWDIQAGSDGMTACATCHFQAGADTRSRNQLNPGANGAFDGTGVNFQLTAANYPFVDFAAGRNLDNVAGSAGVRASTFKSVTGAVESTAAVTDPVYGRARQATGIHAPSAVNAVFNHRNFGNGRAQDVFNGVNPWGNRDLAARCWAVLDTAGNVGAWDVRIQRASLASQAVGPALNPVEMSSNGRTFPDLGMKLLASKPLALQAVSGTDSVLGGLAVPGGKGLNTTYAALIQQAFQPKWWNSTKTVKINRKTYTLMQANFSLFWGLAIMLYEGTLVSDQTPMDQYLASRVLDLNGVVVADDPALLDPVVNRLGAEGILMPSNTGPRAVTRADILRGLDLFERPVPPPGTDGIPAGTGVGCILCHLGAETTSASVRNLTAGVEADGAAFKAAGFDIRMERMFMGVRTPPPVAPQPPPPVPLGTDSIIYDNAAYTVDVTDIAGKPVPPQRVRVATYDIGWYNIGVRPTAENTGLGGVDAFGKPLSWVQYFQTTLANPATVLVPGGGLVCADPAGVPVWPPSAPLGTPFAGQVLDPQTSFPILSGGLGKTEDTDVAGSFKTSSLRNVELSGPYFHTGGKATLRQAVELYDEGGDFANANLSPLIRPLMMSQDQLSGLVAFLVSLTDERVLYQRAPFDHPELPLPEGQDAAGADLVRTLGAVGAAGSAAPVSRFLGLNPFQP